MEASEEALTVSQVGAYPVDLTAEGNLDWLYFNSTDAQAYEQKYGAEEISNVVATGRTNGITGDKFAEFCFTDGTNASSNSDTYQQEKRGLIFERRDSGIAFDIAGSTEPRTIRIYTGAYAATVKTEIRLNGEETPIKTLEHTVSASQGHILTLRVQTENDSDVLHVKMFITDVTDETYGSMSIHAVTVNGSNSSELPEDPVTFVSEDIPQQTTHSVNLTSEGNLDWAYFDAEDLQNYEYKDLQETYVDSFIQNVSALGSTGGLTGDRFAEFHFTDGTSRENNTDTYASEKRGIIMNHVGNGLTFDVDSSTTLRTLKLYTGVYQASVKIEVRLNEEETPIATIQRTAGETTGNILTVNFYSENEEDVYHFRIEITDVTDAAYGSVSVHAITLHDDNPPDFVPPDHSGESFQDASQGVLLDHARGTINDLKFQNDAGEWIDVPFRTGGFAGPTWQWNGSSVRLRKSTDVGKDSVHAGEYHPALEEPDGPGLGDSPFAAGGAGTARGYGHDERAAAKECRDAENGDRGDSQGDRARHRGYGNPARNQPKFDLHPGRSDAYTGGRPAEAPRGGGGAGPLGKRTQTEAAGNPRIMRKIADRPLRCMDTGRLSVFPIQTI